MSSETEMSVQNLPLEEIEEPSENLSGASSIEPGTTNGNNEPGTTNENNEPGTTNENNEPGTTNENNEPGTTIEQTATEDLAKSSSTESFNWKSLKSDTNASDAARKRVFQLTASNNKSTYRKVEEAIAVIGTGDGGASVTAILTWILNNYSTLDPSKLKVNVKRAILKGLKGGTLVRSKTSKKALGVSGSFTFPAQRIKLKAVRLEGKKYVFPILQPVSSASNNGEEKPQEPDKVIKRRLSLDTTVVKSSPKRPKGQSKRAVSEISNKPEVSE